MEPMRLIVEDLRRVHEEGVLVARIRAVSRERVGGSARAVVRMSIRLEDPGPDAGLRELKRLARDQALRFLDVS